MKLQERDENILWSLDKLGCATTSQLRRLHGLGSERNAQRVLQRLYPYTNTKRLTENVFYLNKKGKQLTGSDVKPPSLANLEHTVLRNELYLHYNNPPIWLIEQPIYVNKKPYLIPDVTFGFEQKGDRFFLEVDCTQKMVNNLKKIEKYKEIKRLNGGKLPAVIWLTKTDIRVKKLEEASNGLETVVLHVKDLH